MSIFKKAARWAKARAKERSTAAGIATIIGGLIATKLGLPESETILVVTAALGTAGIVHPSSQPGE